MIWKQPVQMINQCLYRVKFRLFVLKNSLYNLKNSLFRHIKEKGVPYLSEVY